MNFLKKLWFRIKFRFAPIYMSVDFGYTKGQTAWAVFKKVDGVIYMIDSGQGKPSLEKLARMDKIYY